MFLRIIQATFGPAKSNGSRQRKKIIKKIHNY
jgi:hypothetical protein